MSGMNTFEFVCLLQGQFFVSRLFGFVYASDSEKKFKKTLSTRRYIYG